MSQNPSKFSQLEEPISMNGVESFQIANTLSFQPEIESIADNWHSVIFSDTRDLN